MTNGELSHKPGVNIRDSYGSGLKAKKYHRGTLVDATKD